MAERVMLKKWEVEGESFFDLPKLHWARDDVGHVFMACENGHVAWLQHDIDAEGNVNPSILCRTQMEDGGECGWHVFARLEDFDGKIQRG